MEWHRATETPKPDTEVLAEVKGFKHNRFVVLKWSEEGWWQHIPRVNDIMPSDGWVGTQGLFVIRWAYIDEKDLALTWEDMKKIEDLCMDVTTLFAMVGRNKDILEQPFYEEVAKRFNEQRKK